MRKTIVYTTLLLCLMAACRRDKAPDYTGNFPKEVGNIILTRCAKSGCHTDNDKGGAGGLSLESWNSLFQGGSGGSVVIPYRHDQSWLSFFVNTYDDLGLKLIPTMPNDDTPLTRDEVLLLQKWIDDGAPNIKGDVAFPNDPERDKFYVTNQGCSEVAVFDTKTGLAMRYVHVGDASNTAPHAVHVSPDGQYWYVIFANTGANMIQKFRTIDDSYVGSIFIDTGMWNTFSFYDNGSKAFVIDFNTGVCRIANADLDKMTSVYFTASEFKSLHGSAVTPDDKNLYVTSQEGNFIFKIPIDDPSSYKKVVLESPDAGTRLDPHYITFTPDGTKYFISCQGSNEVRVFKASNDSLLAVISTGASSFPQEIAFSKSKPYAFVTCMEDPCSTVNCKGSVVVIDYNTLSTLTKLQENLFQPHGVAVDDENGIVMITNRNINPNGPAPHHASVCGGRNGFMRIVYLNTLTFKPGYRTEVSVDPYFVSVKN